VVSVLTVEGFEEFNKKLKQLPDKAKRTEVIMLQKKLAKPVIDAYKAALPVGKRRTHSRITGRKSKNVKKISYTAGNLQRSVRAVSVPASKTGGNPSIVVRPAIKGKNDGYYRFMVVKPDTKVGSGKRGSRIGKNQVVDEARDKALTRTGHFAQKEAREKTAKYIQKKINKMSK
jgi:hypothetical protein